MTIKRTVPIIFLGVGNIGGTLLRQILDCSDAVASRTGLQLTIIALADVSGALIEADGLPEETLRAALEATADGGLLEAVPGIRPLSTVEEVLRPGAILADMTATPKTEPTLRAALEAGCGVVLANKIPLAGPWEKARTLLDHPSLRYECTVGAGLPVIDTLRYLLNTGDRVTRIEGCLSGTLGYLCTELESGASYSAAVAQAKALGYTEPDPRDDLGGKDVARKALILARTAGWPLEEDDLTIEALYSDALTGISIEEFMAATPSLDGEYAARVEEAKAAGKVLRYVAQVGPEGGTVGLVAVEHDGPLGALRGPANYIALHTERYAEVPLVISGPGAGREVTATGVMGDIIKLGALQDYTALRGNRMFEYIHHIAYVVSDMNDAVRIFRDTFELELSDRRVIEGERSVEMAAFRCGPTLVELLRPINHPVLAQFLEEHGPGLHHVAFAMKDLPKRIEELREKGVFVNDPFVAGTGWRIAYFDLDKSGLALFQSHYHGDHIAEAEPQK